MTPYDDLVYALHAHDQYPFLIEAFTKRRPIVPSHDPATDNTETWKQRSAQQAGFDLCLQILKINLKE